jgi:hypothetical protein
VECILHETPPQNAPKSNLVASSPNLLRSIATNLEQVPLVERWQTLLSTTPSIRWSEKCPPSVPPSARPVSPALPRQRMWEAKTSKTSPVTRHPHVELSA